MLTWGRLWINVQVKTDTMTIKNRIGDGTAPMICDNCKRGITDAIKKDRVERSLSFKPPFITHEVVEEWWCRRCYYWELNGAAAPKYRRGMYE